MPAAKGGRAAIAPAYITPQVPHSAAHVLPRVQGDHLGRARGTETEAPAAELASRGGLEAGRCEATEGRSRTHEGRESHQCRPHVDVEVVRLVRTTEGRPSTDFLMSLHVSSSLYGRIEINK
jgi:hypothetical protein